MARTHPLVIRDMNSDDVDACAALVAKIPLFQPYGYTASSAAADLRGALGAPDRQRLIVAETQERLVGFSRFVLRGGFDRCGYLRLIVVDPDASSSGVGRQMMQFLEEHHLEPFGLLLLCAEENVGAQRFYERLGYRQVGALPDYVKEGLHERIYFKSAGTRHSGD